MASPSQRKGKGRQKVQMEKMVNKTNLQVTFSKRRSGLFKKASELSTLTGCEVGVIVNSPGGKVFSFGHPSVPKVVDKCFPGIPPSVGLHAERFVEAHTSASVAQMNMELTALDSEIELEKERAAVLQMRERVELDSHNPIEDMGEKQLETLSALLHELKERIAHMYF